ncbi:LamG domain-containing protein [Tautonia sociabilis]|uniref:LamG domain-containing protein n=1 Tax=Tautonia sociabilis TaxID=2080755 RepID=A0A432ML44_9BACT|nr:hypothetical protein [Tautonia sociabilis]RUL88143.1 hypothetical protein TsocGM_08360 [Tautonia sociabilis]
MTSRIALLLLLLAPASAVADNADRPDVAGDLPLVYSSDRPESDADRSGAWSFTDPDAWRFLIDQGPLVLEQFQASDYEPKVRSPYNIALIEDLDVSDFVLDLEVKQTGRDYGHRDACLFFGHQDPSHFYYVHLGKEADPHAHSIFLVNDEPRVSIAQERTSGTPWTDDWHHVRIVRRVDPGTVAVYFDDMETPVMTSTDTTFTHGRVGVGSFDDTAMFRHIRLWGLLAD